MKRRNSSILVNIDWFTVILYMIMIIVGWLNIYSAVFNENHSSIFDITQNYGKQAIWIGTALVLAFVILIIDSKFFTSFAYVFYGLMIILLLSVLVIGTEVKGSRSWIGVGNFRIQPAEFGKFITNLALAKYLSTLNLKLEKLKTKLVAFALILLPSLIIILQKETGSALVYAAFVFVLYREGLSGSVLIVGGLLIALFIASVLVNEWLLTTVIVALTALLIFLFRTNKPIRKSVIVAGILSIGMVHSIDYIFEKVLQPHQRLRINVLLGKESDIKGAGYHVHQSKIAIGSGGITGKGFLEGTQTKFDFVPDQSTDFIFCTVGEEWGFVGTSIIVLLFLTLLLRLIFLAERQRSVFSRIYGYGVAMIIFFHFTINIGMTIGLVPVIGIPLPFFSYGGSSLWSFTILLFIFIKLDAERLYILR